MLRLLGLTSVAPAAWGSTYLVTTELLPPDRPLLAAALRALPAGLLLLALSPERPRGVWWWRSAVLGTLNIGGFFALLFVAAYRLPGGVAALVGAVQPLVVATLAPRLTGERPQRTVLVAGALGLIGVALLVLRPDASLDPLGLLAAFGGALSMALGILLTKRWAAPVPPLTLTAWQLLAGGALLLPLALLVEGAPPTLTAGNLAGYGYLTVVGTALAYTLWFRGLQALPASRVAALGLLSPLVATTLGWLALDQALAAGQQIGAALVISALVLAQVRDRRIKRALDTDKPRASRLPAAGSPAELHATVPSTDQLHDSKPQALRETHDAGRCPG